MEKSYEKLGVFYLGIAPGALLDAVQGLYALLI